MQAVEIRAFVPSKDFQESKAFYSAKGFEITAISDDLALCTIGQCGFYLQNYYHKEFAENLMLHLTVDDINEFSALLATKENENTRFNPVEDVPWGKVLYMWGPAGELWHITEFAS